MRITIESAERDDLAEIIAVDDDASQLYPTGGIVFDLDDDSPIVVNERARWAREIGDRRVLIARQGPDSPILGFAANDLLDGVAYLDQISVRRSAMRQGVGAALLAASGELAQPHGALWLTTYAHLSWNKPYYERHGFTPVPAAEWPAGIAHHIEEQRACLPDPEQRIAMRRDLRKG